MRAVYTIHEPEHSYQTEDPAVAEAYSRSGLRVTAEVCHED